MEVKGKDSTRPYIKEFRAAVSAVQEFDPSGETAIRIVQRTIREYHTSRRVSSKTFSGKQHEQNQTSPKVQTSTCREETPSLQINPFHATSTGGRSASQNLEDLMEVHNTSGRISSRHPGRQYIGIRERNPGSPTPLPRSDRQKELDNFPDNVS